MKNINLRDLFPEYELDCFVEVPDEDVDVFVASMTGEIAEIYFEAERKESAHDRKMYRYRAHYSLDRGDGIGDEAVSPSPEDIYEGNLMREQLRVALDNLPEPQRRRVKAHYIYGVGKSDIALIEGVAARNVRASISCGLRNLSKSLKNYF